MSCGRAETQVSLYESMILRVRGHFTIRELHKRLELLDYPTRNLAVRVTKIDDDLFELDVCHYKELV